MVGFLTLHTYFMVHNLQKDITRLYMQTAYNISDLIKYSTRYSMLHNKREDIYETIKAISNEQGVKRIRIYNKQGVITYSTDSTEVNKTVDMDAEACNVCHDKSSRQYVSSPRDSIRIFESEGKERILGLVNPIKNDRDCYTAECHAHNSRNKLLGVLDVMVSMKDAENTVIQNQKYTIYSSFIITVIMSGFAGLFILYLVNKPLKNLQKGITELGKGNWNYRILVRSRSELGEIAREFNEMSRQLAQAYNEIKDWSDNLNVKVEEKTKELKNIYEQVVQMEKLASLGKLSATVAHELNNPLEGILTYSKLISKKLKGRDDDPAIEKINNYLTLIIDESSRCGNIVKDLLLFSHRSEDQFTNNDLVDIIEKCALLINHHLEIHNIKLKKNYDLNSLIITCNPQKIQQAIISLLINSIEAMSNRGGTITIELTHDGVNAILRIKDEGYGIDEKDIPYIFEPFFTTKEAAKGTGLGLSIVYGIISSHKGNIEVESTSDMGTTFKLTLPLTI
ncbi:MAG: HAMP domain-containing histidine kinase [Bacteroidetes bacterium]|nr:HAMP domain-containing histidine kinase [Bacteroidota bacterium]